MPFPDDPGPIQPSPAPATHPRSACSLPAPSGTTSPPRQDCSGASRFGPRDSWKSDRKESASVLPGIRWWQDRFDHVSNTGALSPNARQENQDWPSPPPVIPRWLDRGETRCRRQSPSSRELRGSGIDSHDAPKHVDHPGVVFRPQTRLAERIESWQVGGIQAAGALDVGGEQRGERLPLLLGQA